VEKEKRQEKTEKLKGPNALHIVLRQDAQNSSATCSLFIFGFSGSTASGTFSSYFPSIVHQDVYL